MLSQEEEENLLRLLTSGDLANVMLAFQLQEGFQSPAFEEKVRVYKILLPYFGHSNKEEALKKNIAYMGDLCKVEKLTHRSEELSFLPEEIGELCNLKSLEIDSSMFNKLPDALCTLQKLEMLCVIAPLEKLPDDIGNCVSLQKLEIYNASIRVLPPSIGRAEALTEVVLVNTYELEELPAAIGAWKNLRIFICSGCWASLPAEIGEWRNLEEILLDSDELAILPDVWGNFEHLHTISMRALCLETLPDSFYCLPALENLKLQDMPIRAMEQLNTYHLKYLSLTGNQFDYLPAFVSHLPAIEHLHICRQSHLKALPSISNTWQTLVFLHIIDTPLVEDISPINWHNMPKLLNVTLDGTSVQDITPLTALKDSLKALHLRRNGFTNLPRELASLRELGQLDISDNHFAHIPDVLCELPSLYELRLEKNNFINFPEKIYSLPALRLLSLENNPFLDNETERRVAIEAKAQTAIDIRIGREYQ